MARHLLPLSIFALAAAVAFHAIAPAQASDASAMPVECKVGTEKNFQGLIDSGRDKFLALDTIVCAWR